MSKKLAKAHEIDSSTQEIKGGKNVPVINKSEKLLSQDNMRKENFGSRHLRISGRRKNGMYGQRPIYVKEVGKSLTVPNMALTVEQAFRKSTHGVPVSTKQVSTAPIDVDRFAKMDTIDRIQYMRDLRRKANEAVEKYNQQQINAEKAKQEEALNKLKEDHRKQMEEMQSKIEKGGK